LRADATKTQQKTPNHPPKNNPRRAPQTGSYLHCDRDDDQEGKVKRCTRETHDDASVQKRRGKKREGKRVSSGHRLVDWSQTKSSQGALVEDAEKR